MDYDDSRWTKRRRVKMKVQEHLNYLEGCQNDIVPTNMYFNASEEDFKSHGSNNSNDKQICGHHSECGLKVMKNHILKLFPNTVLKSKMIRLIRKAQLKNQTLVALVTLEGN